MGSRSKTVERIVALGAMTFGSQTNSVTAERMLDSFLDEGYTWVDTAYIYNEGRSERMLGRLLRGGRRQRVFLATKANPGPLQPGKPSGCLTPQSIRRQINTSLKRLRTDHVDLFYLHAPDNKTPLEVSLEACQALKDEGKVGEIGLSNYASWQVAEAVGICLRNNWTPPMIYQGMYNAIARDVERECLVACRHFGLDFIAYNPLAGGLLTGKYPNLESIPKTGRFSREFYRMRYWKKEYFEVVAKLQAISRRARIPLGEAALRWLMHHSMSDGILLGASTFEHFQQNLAACRKRPLSPTFCKAFDDAWAIARPACQRYFRD